MVKIIGAGPGAKDLITVRGMRALQEADVIIYAGSLVNEELLEYAKKECEIYNSAYMNLDEVIDVIVKAEQAGKKVVRLHTGDPSIYGAIREQIEVLATHGIQCEICPGVSSFLAAAAALNCEYTVPEVSQTVILTRMEGRTPVPEKEKLSLLAQHGASMAVFLSAGHLKELQEQLIEDSISKLAKKVKYTYSSLLEEVFQQLDEEKVCRAAEMVSSYKRVLVCGLGSSGYAASEMAFRMMRLGLQIQAVTDSQVIQMSAAVADKDCLMIAISLSGNTQAIADAVHMAKSRGAGVVLITANREAEIDCDVVLYTATSRNLDQGIAISPQFPILVLTDIFYGYYFKNDTKIKSQRYHMTLETLNQKKS